VMSAFFVLTIHPTQYVIPKGCHRFV